MTETNVKSIVHDWLVENNFEGLVSERRECGCPVDDLFPCGFDCVETCLPAYRYICDGEGYYSTVPHGDENNSGQGDENEVLF